MRTHAQYLPRSVENYRGSALRTALHRFPSVYLTGMPKNGVRNAWQRLGVGYLSSVFPPGQGDIDGVYEYHYYTGLAQVMLGQHNSMIAIGAKGEQSAWSPCAPKKLY